MVVSELELLPKGDFIDDSYLRLTYDQGPIRVLGSGEMGKVIVGAKMQKEEKTLVAVKVLETYDHDVVKNYVKCLKNLEVLKKDHRNIMGHLKIHVLNRENLFQVFVEMALADMSLAMILRKRGSLEEREILEIISDLLSGLIFAHERKIAHMDLKPENILIKEGVFMIADWGCSLNLRSSGSTVSNSRITLNPGYNAPEVDKYFGKKDKCDFCLCDVYSLGMIALRMCGIEFCKINSIPKDENFRKSHDAKLDLFFNLLKQQYSDFLLKLLRGMTMFDCQSRMSPKEIEESISNEKASKSK